MTPSRKLIHDKTNNKMEILTADKLRIGNIIGSAHNWFNQETWVIGKVVSISSLDTNFEQIEVETNENFDWFWKDSYFGIPFSEEWLIKLGFSLLTPVTNQGEFRVYSLHFLTYNTKHGWWLCGRQMDVQIRFIHEIQNIIQSIIGVELDVRIDQ